MKRLIEITEYEHKGITVTVKIDHLNHCVSLVERVIGGFENKHWVFAERGLEYMKSWQNILDAIKFAIDEATKLLEHDLAESSKFKEQQIQNFHAPSLPSIRPKKKK